MIDKIIGFFTGKEKLDSWTRFMIILGCVLVAVVWMHGMNLEKEEETVSDLPISGIEDQNGKKDMITVEIKGEVVSPGVYQLEEGSRASDLIREAGGLTEKADMEKVNQVDILRDGDMLRIPSAEEAKTKKTSSGSSSPSSKTPTVVNVNTATAEEIAKITGIGASSALRVVEYRSANGRYEKPADLQKAGLFPSTIEQISGKITF